MARNGRRGHGHGRHDAAAGAAGDRQDPRARVEDEAIVERTEPLPRTASRPTAIRPRVAVRSTPTIDSPSTREPTSSARERPARLAGRSTPESRTAADAHDEQRHIDHRVGRERIHHDQIECVCLVVTPRPRPPSARPARRCTARRRADLVPTGGAAQPTAPIRRTSCTSVAAPAPVRHVAPIPSHAGGTAPPARPRSGSPSSNDVRRACTAVVARGSRSRSCLAIPARHRARHSQTEDTASPTGAGRTALRGRGARRRRRRPRRGRPGQMAEPGATRSLIGAPASS